MNEPFYATIKIITGEELLAEVVESEENDVEFYILSNAITIGETSTIDNDKGVSISSLTPKKWMNYANDDMSILYKNHVVSISQLDKYGVDFYMKALVSAKVSSPVKRKMDTKDHYGYLGNVEHFRERLERKWGKNTQ